VPAVAVEHQYIVTEKIAGLPSGLPSFRDPDGNFYVKPEVGALAVGGWEADVPTFGETGVPPDFARELLASNFDRFAEIAAPARRRLPVLDEVGVRTLINGPIPISPDGEPVLGKAPGLENAFLACGFTSGIAASGGAGRAVAEWILAGEPGLDLASLDPRRFGPMNGPELHARAVESYGRYYAISRGEGQ